MAERKSRRRLPTVAKKRSRARIGSARRARDKRARHPSASLPNLHVIDEAIGEYRRLKDALDPVERALKKQTKELVRLARAHGSRRRQTYHLVGRVSFAVLQHLAAAWVKRHRRNAFWRVDRAVFSETPFGKAQQRRRGRR
ncbi:MAG: hypothetical protein ACE5IP_09290 [Terriglobia bacterium]